MLLDIAFGLFAGNYFGYKVIGVLLALLPDIDFITHYFYINYCDSINNADINTNYIYYNLYI